MRKSYNPAVSFRISARKRVEIVRQVVQYGWRPCGDWNYYLGRSQEQMVRAGVTVDRYLDLECAVLDVGEIRYAAFRVTGSGRTYWTLWRIRDMRLRYDWGAREYTGVWLGYVEEAQLRDVAA